MSSQDQSWNEIKIAREIWPPNTEKILLQYHRAEAIDPKYFQIYKDRARLFYVLNQIKKSNEDYERWRSLDTKWENEVDLEIDLRKNFSNKNIYPWEKLKKYFEKDSEVIKKEFEMADRKENREEREEEERKEWAERRRGEQEGQKERRIEKSRNKRERERKRKEEISEGRWAHNSIKTSYSGLDLDVDFDSDENMEFMYQNLFNFQIIGVEIQDGFQHTIDTIQKKDGSFKGYFKYLNKVDENDESNFTKLYEFCKIKLETENFYELEFENLINKTD
ncbi:MAG: hypothetical protein OPY04_06720, partial [Nitrosopumilus sp.]|nr:hypothetical protein [Nitrosopumilus sp.]